MKDRAWIERPVWWLQGDAPFLADAGIDYLSVPELAEQKERAEIAKREASRG